ncbi:hypothetical protein [Protaetiibacter larvae]|uniref:hypothetical protein n=1 Tax=Protaetiibacter larvae TaxID=2592654 RepID=UPI00143DC229|nr:hypothetical protein [Protaetiibacter larvae]
MITSEELALHALLDELEEPLVQVIDVLEADEIDDDFDGECTAHEGCRSIR